MPPPKRTLGQALPRWEPLLWGLAVAGHLGFIGASLANKGYWAWDDAVEYATLAENLRSVGVFSLDLVAPFAPTAERLPGYPVFLVALGGIPAIVLGVQHVLVFLTAWGLYRLLKPVIGVFRARQTALAWCLLPYPALFASSYLTETLFVALVVWGVAFSVRFIRSQQNWPAAVGPALLGVAVLVKGLALPIALLAIPILLGVALWQKRWLALPAILLGCTLAAIGPLFWQSRNHAQLGQRTLTTGAHISHWYGRVGAVAARVAGAPATDDAYFRHADSLGGASTQPEPLYDPNGRLHPKAAQAGWRFLAAHPRATLVVHGRALVQMGKGVGYQAALKTTHSQLLGVLLAGFQGIGNLVLWAGFCVYLFRLRRQPWLAHIAFGVVLVLVGLHLVAWADGRYRFIADPFLLILAAVNLPELLAKPNPGT